jgi:hypothetical protein
MSSFYSSDEEEVYNNDFIELEISKSWYLDVSTYHKSIWLYGFKGYSFNSALALMELHDFRMNDKFFYTYELAYYGHDTIPNFNYKILNYYYSKPVNNFRVIIEDVNNYEFFNSDYYSDIHYVFKVNSSTFYQYFIDVYKKTKIYFLYLNSETNEEYGVKKKGNKEGKKEKKEKKEGDEDSEEDGSNGVDEDSDECIKEFSDEDINEHINECSEEGSDEGSNEEDEVYKSKLKPFTFINFEKFSETKFKIKKKYKVTNNVKYYIFYDTTTIKIDFKLNIEPLFNFLLLDNKNIVYFTYFYKTKKEKNTMMDNFNIYKGKNLIVSYQYYENKKQYDFIELGERFFITIHKLSKMKYNIIIDYSIM